MEIRCHGKKKIGGYWQRCKKKLFINNTASGEIEIKCPKCKTVQIINLEGKHE